MTREQRVEAPPEPAVSPGEQDDKDETEEEAPRACAVPFALRRVACPAVPLGQRLADEIRAVNAELGAALPNEIQAGASSWIGLQGHRPAEIWLDETIDEYEDEFAFRVHEKDGFAEGRLPLHFAFMLVWYLEEDWMSEPLRLRATKVTTAAEAWYIPAIDEMPQADAEDGEDLAQIGKAREDSEEDFLSAVCPDLLKTICPERDTAAEARCL